VRLRDVRFLQLTCEENGSSVLPNTEPLVQALKSPTSGLRSSSLSVAGFLGRPTLLKPSSLDYRWSITAEAKSLGSGWGRRHHPFTAVGRMVRTPQAFSSGAAASPDPRDSRLGAARHVVAGDASDEPRRSNR